MCVKLWFQNLSFFFFFFFYCNGSYSPKIYILYIASTTLNTGYEKMHYLEIVVVEEKKKYSYCFFCLLSFIFL